MKALKTETGWWEDSWTYIKTVVDVVREPVIILDKELKVMAANESFYRTFQVDQKETEGKIVYKLGNGQWDIPALRKLLEDILPKNTFFKGFEVTHVFPSIGHKVIILNARQIHFREEADCEPIIMLAMEDVTDIMLIAEKLATHTNEFEETMAKRADKLEKRFKELAESVGQLKKRK